DKFPTLASAGGSATFRLQPFNAVSEATLSDATLCPDRSYTFNDPNAPTITWKAHKQGGVDIVWSVATSSRARASNVATIVTGAAHGFATGGRIKASGLGAAAYNVEDVTVTVINPTTFTYANAGSDEATTADTGGVVERIFGQTDELQFSFEAADASADLVETKMLARLGVNELMLWSKTYQASPVKNETVPFKLNADGDWRITCLAKDAAGRVTQKVLTKVGDAAEVFVKIRTSGSNKVANPLASPPGSGFPTFPITIGLSCSTPGAAIEYQVVSSGASAGGSWTAYSSAFQITGPRTIYARASKGGMTTSD